MAGDELLRRRSLERDSHEALRINEEATARTTQIAGRQRTGLSAGTNAALTAGNTAGLVHENRIRQLRQQVVQRRMAREAEMIAEDLSVKNVAQGIEVIGAMDIQAVNADLERMRIRNLRKQTINNTEVLLREATLQYPQPLTISLEELQFRQNMKFAGFMELYRSFTEVAVSEEDRAVITQYENALELFRVKFITGDNQLAEIDEEQTPRQKGIAAVDAILIRSFCSGSTNIGNQAVISQLMKRTEDERLLVYALIEKGIEDDIGFADMVSIATDYVPDAQKIYEKIKPGAFLSFFGKKKLDVDVILNAVHVCEKKQTEIAFLRQTRDVAEGLQKATLTDEQPADYDSIVSQRAVCLLMCTKAAGDLARFSKKKNKTKEDKKRAKAIARELEEKLNLLVSLDNKLTDGDAAENPENREAAGVTVKGVVKGAVKATGLIAPIAGMGVNFAKQPFAVLGSMGKSIGDASDAIKEGVTKKWHLPQDIVQRMTEAGEKGKLEAIGAAAESIKGTLNAIGIAGTVISSVTFVLSAYKYATTFKTQTVSDRVYNGIDLANQGATVLNGTLVALKAYEVGGTAAAELMGSASGVLSLGIGAVNVGLGVYGLAENMGVRRIKRNSATGKLAAQTQQRRMQISNDATLDLQTRQQREQEVVEKARYDANLIKLSKRMSQRKNLSAGFKLATGVLALGAGFATVGGAYVIGAGLGALAFAAGTAGFISDLIVKSADKTVAVDEYLQLDTKVGEMSRRLGADPKSKQMKNYRKALKKELMLQAGYSSESTFYGYMMHDYANRIYDGIFNNPGGDPTAYHDLARSMGLKVKLEKGYPTREMIYTKLTS